MSGPSSPILGIEKAAPARAAQSEESVSRQTPRHHFRTPDPRLNTQQRERLARKAERSTSRVQGAGLRRLPLAEVVA
jgi:hypothetical protein